MFKKILTLIIATTSFAFANKIIAEVDGRKITEEQFNTYYNQRLLFVSNKKVTKKSVLDELINQEVGIIHAQKMKIEKDPVVKRKIEELAYHAQISKELEGEFKKIKVTDKEVQEYYSTNKEFRTAHILTRIRANPDAKELTKALEVSRDLYNQVLKDPSKFNEIAAKFSQSENGQVGGDLGYQPPTRYAPEYYEAIKGKTEGTITQPVRTQYGFHIIKILGVKKIEDINKNLYKKIIYDIKRDRIIDEYHAKLRNNAKVKIIEKFTN